MSIKQYKTFVAKYGEGTRHRELSQAQLAPYRDALSPEVYELLQAEGIASFMDGFLWTLDPSEYTDWLNQWVQLDGVCVPFARTALGDLLFMRNQYISLLYASRGLMEYLLPRLDWVLDKYLVDDKYVDTYLHRHLFTELSPEQRSVRFDQCLGFDPLPADGSAEEAQNLRIHQLTDYLTALSRARPAVDFVEY